MDAVKSSLEIIGKILLLMLFIFVIIFILFIPVGIVGIVIVGIDVEMIEESMEQLLASTFFEQSMMYIQMIAFIGAVMIMYALFERGKGFDMGWRQSHALTYGLSGSVWGIVLITASFVLVWAMGGLRIVGFSLNGEVLTSLLSGIILYALVAINEELVSRGYIQGLVRRRFGITVAIVVTSLIFAALHLGNAHVFETPFSIINLFLVGVLLGLTREVTGGLWVPIGIHFTWNLFQGNVYGISVSGNDLGKSILETEQTTAHHYISGGYFGLEGSVIASLVIIAGTYMWWQRYKATAGKVG